MRFSFLLASILQVTAKLTLFDGQNLKVSVPTFNFFEHRSNAFNVTGVACRLELVKDPKTQLCKAIAPAPLNSTAFAKNFEHTVLYSVFGEMESCGIRTISQLFEKAHETMPFLAEAGYPPSNTLVVFTTRPYKGVVGCPSNEPYMAPSISIPDSPPPRNLNVILVGGSDTLKIIDIPDIPDIFALSVVQETDLWNGTFLSTSYLFFNWSVITIYFLSIIAAIWLIYDAYKRGTIVMDLRNLIFWMAVLVSILYTVALPMGYQTYIRRHLELVGELICTIAFYVLLYLWTVILKKIQPSYGIYALRGVIFIGILVAIAGTVRNLIYFNYLNDVPTMKKISDIVFIVVVSLQSMMALIFMVFAVKFHLRKKLLNASEQLVAAFARLSMVAFLGFVCIAMTACSNLPHFRDNSCEPGSLVTMTVLRQISVIMRVMVLLFVLGVKTNGAKLKEYSIPKTTWASSE